MVDELPAVIVVMALVAEGAGRFERQGIPVLYTGVGKVNAAAALARRLAQYRCADLAQPLVVTFGTRKGLPDRGCGLCLRKVRQRWRRRGRRA